VIFGGLLTLWSSAALARLSRSQPLKSRGERLIRTNLPAVAPERGGNREGAAEACLVSRWVRGVVQGCTVYRPKDGILLITAGSSMPAMIRSAPPPARQVSMSMRDASGRVPSRRGATDDCETAAA
jgi:hypothetical protein